MIWSILHGIDITLWVIIAGSVAYVVFFAIISLFYDKEDHIAAHAAALSNKQCRFLILYPAYKEDRVIINAVENFLLQDYPKTHYTLAVVSDHMQPETNDYLRQLPITLLEPVFEKSSKAKAMQYAINQVKGDFDQVVVLDADNIVRPDFLSQLNILSTVYDAIQCHRCAKNADNDVAVLDGASEEINNTIFRKAHNRLGLSSALIGSGMCFKYELFKKNVFELKTAGEDREMEALLLHQEIFIKYAPEQLCRQDHPAGPHPPFHSNCIIGRHFYLYDHLYAHLVRKVVDTLCLIGSISLHCPPPPTPFSIFCQGSRYPRSCPSNAQEPSSLGPEKYRFYSYSTRLIYTVIMTEKWDIIITNRSKLLSIDLHEVWRYRDLLAMYVKRDIITFYKQTILGPLWFVIQPLFTTIMFMFVFGGIAGISTDGIPQAVFYLAGLVCWNYFQDCLSKCSDTFNANQAIFGKVYFPRLVVPLSIVISNLIKMVIQFALFLFVYIYYFASGVDFNINATILLVPILIIMLGCLGLGFGMIISSMTTKYRDLRFLITFGVQLWMYATPVIYPLSVMKDTYPKYIWVLVANPLTAILETFKYAFTGVGEFNWFYLSYSIAFSIIILMLGIIIFNRVQRNFMDVI